MGFIRCALSVLISTFCVFGERLSGTGNVYIQNGTMPIPQTTGKLTLLDWNILAPIWIDKEMMKGTGLWDMNLLNDETRLELIIKHILDSDADIVTLQEVQQDVYSSIRYRIIKSYSAVGFAPNINGYWESFLPKGVEHVKNGVATFYKRKKFAKMAHNTFAVGTQGNIGLAAVFRPKRRLFGSKSSSPTNPIIVLNFHLESGLTVAESGVRVQQSTAVINEAKRISTGVAEKFPKTKPVVILCGDVNSFRPFPGFTNFESQGYLDSMEVTGNNAFSYFQPQPVTLPGGMVISASTIDHVFVRKSDMDGGRIKVESVKTPDITSDELNEKSYIDNVVAILGKALRRKKVKKQLDIISYLLDSKIFSKLQKSSKDDSEFDTNINRALRLGSDHLSLLVEFKFTM